MTFQVRSRVTVHIFVLSFRPFSGLVCDLLLRGGRGLSPEDALLEEYLGHNFDEHCLEDTRVVWCLFYSNGGAPFLGRYVPKFLGS